MDKKILIEVHQAWEAEAIGNALQQAGIEFEAVQKAKEYSSIISGIDSISILIYVEEQKYIQASEVLKKISSQDKNAAPEEPLVRNYFRRVIIFSMIGVLLLPLVFNLVATFNYVHMKEQNLSPGKRIFAGIVLALGWVMASFMLFFLLHE